MVIRMNLNPKIIKGIMSAAIFLGLILIINSREFYARSILSLEVKAPSSDTYKIFYDVGRGYNEADSAMSPVGESGAFSRIEFRLPAERIDKIRIDPGTKQGSIVINSLCLEDPHSKHCWTSSDIVKDYRPLKDISAFGIENNSLHIESSGIDPYFEYSRSDFSGFQPRIKKIYPTLAAALVSLILFPTLYFIGAIKVILASKSSWFYNLVRYRYLIALILFSILVMGKLHGSALPYWDNIIKEKIDTHSNSLLLGKARGIRSDEWNIQTPFYFSQSQNKQFYPLVNSNIRSEGQNMLLSFYAPVFDITMIGKPFNWGFFLFGKEYGLSWYWWSKLLTLFLLSFEISLLLTNRDLFISAIGAFWITFSPFVQWVYALWLVDLIIYSQAIIVAVWHYVHTTDKRVKFLLATVFTMSALGFIFSLYPRFQIPLGYLTLLFLMVIIYDCRSSIKFERYDIILVISALMVVGISVYLFVSRSSEAMRVMLGTVYPGRQVNTGGAFDVNYLQLYLINWLLPYKAASFLNECELSTFLNFLPAMAFVFFKVYKLDDRIKYLGLALLCYILFQGSWLFIRFPESVARYSFFSFVTEHRLHVILNLTALYLSLLIFHLLSKYKPLTRLEAVVISLFVLIIYYYSITHSSMLDYLRPLYAMFTLLFFFALNVFFLRGNRRLFGGFLIIYIVVSGLTVNPLSRGAGPIYNKVAAQKILELEHKDPGQKWAGVNSLLLGNYLISLGLKSFNSVHYYPDMNMWKTLDPDGKYVQVYNRYAIVQVRLTEDKTYFEPDPLHGDVFTVFINGRDLSRIGVKYLFSSGRLSGNDVREVDKVESDNLYIYEVKK